VKAYQRKELFSKQKVARESLLRLAHCGTGNGHQRKKIDSFGIKKFVGGEVQHLY